VFDVLLEHHVWDGTDIAACQFNRPQVASFIPNPSFDPHVTTSRAYWVYVRCCGSCEFAQHDGPRGVPLPHLPYLLPFDRRPDLVPQDHGIDTVPALHATEGLDAVFAGVIQVVVPLVHEQAFATSAGSCAELFARGMGPNGISTSAFCHRSLSHCFS
jgi:hypothetical protein